MSQFLFVVEPPPLPDGTPAPPQDQAERLDFAFDALSLLQGASGTTRLQQNAWLLPVDNGLPLLAELVALAGKHALSYSCVLLPDGAQVLALDVRAAPLK